MPLHDLFWLDGTHSGTPGSLGDEWCDLPEGQLVHLEPPHHDWTIYLPCHFEPGYAYPLIVWLPTSSSGRQELATWLPLISDRNYIAIAAASAGPNSRYGGGRMQGLAGGRLAAPAEPGRAEVVEAAISAAVSQVPIHPERIVLAGAGAAAAEVLEIGLAGSRTFAGVAAIDPGRIPLQALLQNFRRLRGRDVFLADLQDEPRPGRLDELADLLSTTGVRLALHGRGSRGDCAAATRLAAAARALDAWIMQLVRQTSSGAVAATWAGVSE